MVPLLAVAVAWRMRALPGLCALACLLTLVEFPPLYLELAQGDRLATVVTALRNAALIGAVAVAVAALWRSARQQAGAPISAAATAPARSIGRARPAPPR